MMKWATSFSCVGVLCIMSACGGDDSKAPASGPSSDAAASTPSCDAVCPAVLAAHCAAGPVNQADCVSGCQSIRAGKCADKYAALLDCAGSNPTFSCTSSGMVTVAACDTLGTALYSCLAGP
jgi:hypothetical protein